VLQHFTLLRVAFGVDVDQYPVEWLHPRGPDLVFNFAQFNFLIQAVQVGQDLECAVSGVDLVLFHYAEVGFSVTVGQFEVCDGEFVIKCVWFKNSVLMDCVVVHLKFPFFEIIHLDFSFRNFVTIKCLIIFNQSVRYRINFVVSLEINHSTDVN